MRALRLWFVPVIILVLIAVAARPVRFDAAESDAAPARQTWQVLSVTTLATDTITIPTYPYAAYLYTETNGAYHIPYQKLSLQ